MTGRVIGAAHALARNQTGFVFRVKGRTSAEARDNSVERLFIVDEQIAGR